ncbi:hypothetical protein [Jannaschia pohangensis]|uniref:YARHG domain-containing protein n=1 Tax=Jannaschia pohangensis TaxID=390807 RepID=A0A1I3TUE1_9RHOB|nr:hypothetical protein [Jannaschia pohangensis]SFJ74405.1 hypothetical protein SAMN04488095_3535 [Jannaschia pohangensis]
MTKTLLSTSLVASLIALSALPAAADRMVIDDDRWFMADDRPSGPAIEIEDDYWRLIDAPETASQRDAGGIPGDCSGLESSAGLSGADCGTLSRAEVIQILAND